LALGTFGEFGHLTLFLSDLGLLLSFFCLHDHVHPRRRVGWTGPEGFHIAAGGQLDHFHEHCRRVGVMLGGCGNPDLNAFHGSDRRADHLLPLAVLATRDPTPGHHLIDEPPVRRM
jgi:hypothetical protein